MSLKLLRAVPASIPRFSGRSDALEQTKVPAYADPRAFYLDDYKRAPGPIISHSEFVPSTMVAHLMRNKKDQAIGVKFSDYPGSKDAITNMEGALHTFVSPFADSLMHGDYIYRGGHNVVEFPDVAGFQQARRVVLSALVQPDFERREVMLKVVALQDQPCAGAVLPSDFQVPSVFEKHDAGTRVAYDETLRRHMVYHLTHSHTLPAISTVSASSREHVHQLLEKLAAGILPEGAESIPAAVQNIFAKKERAGIISVEMLFWTAFHQMRNEFGALEHLCKEQGYVYTFDPPRIFVQVLEPGGAELLTRCQAAAIRYLLDGEHVPSMRAFGFGDFADKAAVPLFKTAFAKQPHVIVLSKYDLFKGPGSTYKPTDRRMERSLLVIHNNSDGFGQNIQTESPHGSLDGMIGSVSSAAASLHRQHPHLLDNMC